MDTGGKVATGLLIPLAIGAALVGGYFIGKGRGEGKKDESKIEIPIVQKVVGPAPRLFGGKRRRTHRRRR